MRYIIIDKGTTCIIRHCNFVKLLFYIIWCKIRKYRYIVKE